MTSKSQILSILYCLLLIVSMAFAVKVGNSVDAQAATKSEIKVESSSQVEQDWLNDLIESILDQLPLPVWVRDLVIFFICELDFNGDICEDDE